ncbi:hypothetical protein AAG570_009485 [Ranatra chinensis]|uniref:Chromo domain-containing protein n=1 Tax=Ranatra chinensis TaxID=642074 RepID=A0ABD0ZCH6_9HEMI
MRKFVQRDHLGEIKEIRSSGIMKKKLKEDIENIRNQLEDGDSSQEKEPEGQEGGEMVLQEEEFVVEKIVSRRFNPRKKQYEYLIKWEGYPSEQNTWEPAENMEACQHLLKAFEESLTKQSIVTTTTNPSRKTDNTQAGPSGLNSFGRPVRYSKQKALNQVKAWCGSIKPDDVELDMKRKFGGTDSDEEDPATKRIKMELESDSEDSLMGGNFMYTKGGNSGIVKRGRGRVSQSKQQNTISNGTDSTDNLAAALGLESSGDEGDPNKTKSTLALLNQKSMVKKVSSLSPANQQVLVANAKGVVKIDPSQVPNLTSGVYIMSNKSGIIKLDSVSPSKALSMKQGTPVKQAPPSPKGGVIMLKNHGPGTQKSGIVRKNPGILKSGVTSRGPGRPPNPRPSGTIRIENPNTR